MRMRRLLAALLTLALLVGCAAVPALAAGDPLTRGEARDMLLAAADDYNPGVTAEDILQGDETGALHEDRPVTRAEALVMLSRAFGDLPAPEGDNARRAYDNSRFTDVPVWAQTELADVLEAGIIAGTSATTLSPGGVMTAEQLELLIDRVYALEGSNLRDDFYATVNRDWLNAATIPAGYAATGTIYEMTVLANEQVAGIIAEIVAGEPEDGTPEARVKNLYENVVDWEARDAAGAEPVRPWLEAVDNAATLEELMAVHCDIAQEAAVSLLMGFGLTTDLADSTRNRVTFAAMYPSLGAAESYADSATRDAYLRYLTTLLTLGGYDEARAAREAETYFQMEAALAQSMMDRQDAGDVDQVYNLYAFEQLQEMFPNVDLQAVLDATGFQITDEILVDDPALLEVVRGVL